MYIFFLLLQKMIRNCVQRVTPQLVIPDQDEQKIQLNPTFNINHFILALPHLLALQDRFPNLTLNILNPSKELEISHPQVLSPIDQVGPVKVVNIIAGDDVGVDLPDEFGPFFKQHFLFFARQDVGAHDGGAGVQGEHVADEGLRVALSNHHVGDLDDGVDFGLGEDTLSDMGSN